MANETKIKVGDRVRLARISEYDLMVCRSLNLPVPIGITGVVLERAYSRSHGDVLTVLEDESKCRSIWCEKDSELIND